MEIIYVFVIMLVGLMMFVLHVMFELPDKGDVDLCQELRDKGWLEIDIQSHMVRNDRLYCAPKEVKR